MGTDDKIDAKGDELKGKVKEGVGDATGDRDLQAEGEVDQTKGKAKQAWGDVKNAGEKTKQGASVLPVTNQAADYDLLDPRNWISPADLAAILGMHEQSIYNLIHTGGDLPPNYKKGRSVRFFRPEVEAWLVSGRRVPASTQIISAAAAGKG